MSHKIFTILYGCSIIPQGCSRVGTREMFVILYEITGQANQNNFNELIACCPYDCQTQSQCNNYFDFVLEKCQKSRYHMHPHKKEQAEKACSLYGAADRGRTDTVSLPQDFESSASANSTTAACHQLVYYNTLCFKNQPFFSNFLNFFKKILKANTAKGFKAALAQRICLKNKFQTCTK